MKKNGLKEVDSDDDGNCMFSSLADQLFGDQSRHDELRVETVRYIKSNRDYYSLFIEDDENIDEYIRWIARDGHWGGQLEMNVLAHVYQFNLIVMQVGKPNVE